MKTWLKILMAIGIIGLLSISLIQNRKITEQAGYIDHLDREIEDLSEDLQKQTERLTISRETVEQLTITLTKYQQMDGIIVAFSDAGIEAESLEEINHLLSLAERAPFGSPFKEDYLITSPFGLRDEALWSGDGNHGGIDLIPVGGDRTIYFTADGVVESYDYDETYGWNMVVNHGDYKTRYAHLEYAYWQDVENERIIGVEVKKGNRLGRMGASGFSYGAHLHYEIWIKGYGDEWILLDPTEILKFIG